MIKLHGLAISNYYNIAKLCLLEKGIPFEEIRAQPSQEEAFLKLSPLGKIPVLEIPEGTFSESQAILFYAEAIRPEPPLYPSEPFLAALAQQIHQIIDLYVDPPARSLLGAAYFGKTASAGEIGAAQEKLAMVATALKRVAVFTPFIAGDRLTHADLTAFFTLNLASATLKRLNLNDPFADWESLANFRQHMAQRPTVKKVVDDQMAAMQTLFGES